jgi:hypothetical protein
MDRTQATVIVTGANCLNADYNPNNSLVPVVVGTVVWVNGMISLDPTDASSATYSINGNSASTVGALRYVQETSETAALIVAIGANLLNYSSDYPANAITLSYAEDSYFLSMTDKVGSLLFDEFELNPIIPVPRGTRTEIELDWSSVEGITTVQFFINGGQILGDIVAPFGMGRSGTAVRLILASTADGGTLIGNVMIFNAIQHTTAYTAGYYPYSVVTSGELYIRDSTNSVSPSSGCGIFVGGVGVGGSLYADGPIYATNTTPSTSVSTGALVIPSGGIGLSGNLSMKEPTITYLIDGQTSLDATYNVGTTGLRYITSSDVSISGSRMLVSAGGVIQYPINGLNDMGYRGTVKVYYTPLFDGNPSHKITILLLGTEGESNSLGFYHMAADNEFRVYAYDSLGTELLLANIPYTGSNGVETIFEFGWHLTGSLGNVYTFVDGAICSGPYSFSTTSWRLPVYTLTIGDASTEDDFKVREIMLYNEIEHAISYTPVY